MLLKPAVSLSSHKQPREDEEDDEDVRTTTSLIILLQALNRLPAPSDAIERENLSDLIRYTL